MIKKPELLAPAGSFEKAKVAFMYGADAVYCGTGALSLRSRSPITDEELEKIVNYAHSIGKRVHVTLNTYASDDLYDAMEKQIRMLDQIKVDAIIAADGGVIQMIHEIAPNIDIHISTQANTLSAHTAKFWKKNGAKRVILSREMNKEDIRNLIKNIPDDLETEMFIHGAICWAYSGRCFLSQYMSGRSANCGDCAQSCRWKYNVYIEEVNNPGNIMPVEGDENGTYVMSSKDLCLINDIPQILDLGVSSCKIEGRLKSEYYLASVVNAYRTAIDDYVDDPNNFDSSIYMNELNKTKTRDVTDFFFNKKSLDYNVSYDNKQYNLEYEYGGQVTKYSDDKSVVKIGNKLLVGDDMEVIIPGKIEPVKFKINEMWDVETGESVDFVNPGRAGQSILMKLPKECKNGYVIRRKK